MGKRFRFWHTVFEVTSIQREVHYGDFVYGWEVGLRIYLWGQLGEQDQLTDEKGVERRGLEPETWRMPLDKIRQRKLKISLKRINKWEKEV